MQNKLNYLNLGCGSCFHANWINIDIVSTGPGVIAHDLRQGIPMSDNSCAVVYHSHLLEHIRSSDALPFIRECHRVLRGGGVLRVATPDLETICRVYLEKLTAALDDDMPSSYDYNWIILEMYDQAVREQSGGAMLDYLRQDPIPNEAFVHKRIGEEGKQLVQALRHPPQRASIVNYLRRDRERGSPLKKIPDRLYTIYERIIGYLLLRREAFSALTIGRCRLSGEIHQWMYDRYSLSQLLRAAGFEDIIIQTATQSHVPDWADFNLDTTGDGKVRKPDSLFMEAFKPL
jgi:predicted SAM-dependent methyltransferase